MGRKSLIMLLKTKSWKLAFGVVFCLLLVTGCSLFTPDPLDDEEVLGLIQKRLVPDRDLDTLTVTEILNRENSGKAEVVEVTVFLDVGVNDDQFFRKSNEPRKLVESTYKAEFSYEDKEWSLDRLTKIADVKFTPKEGANVSSIVQPIGETYVEGAKKKRYWKRSVTDRVTDLEAGVDELYMFMEADYSLIKESGTIKHTFTFDWDTGEWEQTNEEKMNDWVREYNIGGKWVYKYTSTDGYYERNTLYLSDVSEDGEIEIRLDNNATRFRAYSGLPVGNKWTVKATDDPFVFKAEIPELDIVIPDEGTTNVFKVGGNIYRRD